MAQFAEERKRRKEQDKRNVHALVTSFVMILSGVTYTLTIVSCVPGWERIGTMFQAELLLPGMAMFVGSIVVACQVDFN